VTLILFMCLVASAVGLKTKSYKAWELALGVTTGLALSTTSIGKRVFDPQSSVWFGFRCFARLGLIRR
jgi:hypothetical protein